MNPRRICAILLIAAMEYTIAQTPRVDNIEPPNWWVGMKHDTIQLMLYGENLRECYVQSTSSSIKVVRIHEIENPAYAFVDVAIHPSARPGGYGMRVISRRGETTFSLPLQERQNPNGRHQGFNARDVIYLITPDRFANGDTTNDNVEGMHDRLNRSDPYGRHGGDIQGIINKLEYLSDLGVSALWINPLVENNGRRASYHGYAATDLYTIDARFGTNALYARLVVEAHKRNLKVIMDHVNNHIGINHPWMQNLPSADWLNGTSSNHQKSFHGKLELDDPYSDAVMKQRATLGWFSDAMPDLNQRNQFVAKYLIQNTLWWIEFSGIDGIREDTYPYIDPVFRERWCDAVLEEFPLFNIVGEVWIQDPAYLAPYQRGSTLRKETKPRLPSITDFGLFDAFMKTFADTAGTTEHLFNCLTKDFLYPDPTNLVTFLDNHDIRRIMYNVNGDAKRFKLALLALLTTRGIPQLLYGTEIGMMGGPDHGRLRGDFPGGFPRDERDAFTDLGRTPDEHRVFDYVKQLLALRKSHKSLHTGTLVHYKPIHGVYAYFRELEDEKMLIVINRSTATQNIDLRHFRSQLGNTIRLRDVLGNEEIDILSKTTLYVEGMSGNVYELFD